MMLEIERDPVNGADHMQVEVLDGRIVLSIDNPTRPATCEIVISEFQARQIIAFLKKALAAQ